MYKVFLSGRVGLYTGVSSKVYTHVDVTLLCTQCFYASIYTLSHVDVTLLCTQCFYASIYTLSHVDVTLLCTQCFYASIIYTFVIVELSIALSNSLFQYYFNSCTSTSISTTVQYISDVW